MQTEYRNSYSPRNLLLCVIPLRCKPLFCRVIQLSRNDSLPRDAMRYWPCVRPLCLSQALQTGFVVSKHRRQHRRGHVLGNVCSAGDEVPYIPGSICQVSAVAC